MIFDDDNLKNVIWYLMFEKFIIVIDQILDGLLIRHWWTPYNSRINALPLGKVLMVFAARECKEKRSCVRKQDRSLLSRHSSWLRANIDNCESGVEKMKGETRGRDPGVGVDATRISKIRMICGCLDAGESPTRASQPHGVSHSRGDTYVCKSARIYTHACRGSLPNLS